MNVDTRVAKLQIRILQHRARYMAEASQIACCQTAPKIWRTTTTHSSFPIPSYHGRKQHIDTRTGKQKGIDHDKAMIHVQSAVTQHHTQERAHACQATGTTKHGPQVLETKNCGRIGTHDGEKANAYHNVNGRGDPLYLHIGDEG